MNFRTEIENQQSLFKIYPETQVLSFGSCFSENIGNFLQEKKFNCLSNPLGIIFNPISIFKILKIIMEKEIDPGRIIELNGGFVHYDFHSKFWHKTKEGLVEILRNEIKKARTFLLNTDLLIITFGTAWTHQLSSDKKIVNNCHKQNKGNFTKRLLTLNHIKKEFEEIEKDLKEIRPDLKILLTISPIRHTREGLSNNSLSKSILRLAAHCIQEGKKDVYYFPSYEIMMDDLRDYRFLYRRFYSP